MSFLSFILRFFKSSRIKISVPTTGVTYEEIIAPMTKVVEKLQAFSQVHLDAAIAADIAAAEMAVHAAAMRVKAEAALLFVHNTKNFTA